MTNLKWKASTTLQKLFKTLGYDLHKSIKGKEYTRCLPYGYSTYSPWFEKSFLDLYKEIKSHTLVTEDRCYMIQKFVKHCLKLGRGHFAECGAYKGGTALLIAKLISENETNKKLYVFDSFQGMPRDVNKERDKHEEGDFSDVSLQKVRKLLSPYLNVNIIPGFIPHTFKEVNEDKFSFVHIDVDIYQATKDSLDFFYKRLVKGGIIIFDDYAFPGYRLAEKKAADEFFEDKPEEIIVLRTGQALVIKL